MMMLLVVMIVGEVIRTLHSNRNGIYLYGWLLTKSSVAYKEKLGFSYVRDCQKMSKHTVFVLLHLEGKFC